MSLKSSEGPEHSSGGPEQSGEGLEQSCEGQEQKIALNLCWVRVSWVRMILYDIL
jgi:hypothetical protein